jgi:anaerobic magnesium-protoporphyrin IX monomethyl ester cyclase
MHNLLEMGYTMKVLLIQPRIETVYKTVNFPPMGISYIASVLREHDISVSVFDMRLKNYDRERLASIIKKDKPGIVGISSTTFGFNEAINLAQFIKNISKDIITVMGGPHASIMPEESAKFFDYVVVGEGEYTVLDMVNAIEGKEDITKVKGIVYRKDSKTITTPQRPYIQDLDTLPYPAYDLFPLKDYNLMILPLLTSRGCPYQCIYCSTYKTFGRPFRPRSPDNIFAEIKFMMATYGVRRFDVLDDNFAMDSQRVINLCQQIIDNKLNIKWECGQGIRADRLNEGVLSIMKKAGCTLIAVGIESTSKKVLLSLKKHSDIDKVRKVLMEAKKVGLTTKGFFLIGSPDETYEDFLKSIEFFKDVDIDFPRFGMLVPYPGTELAKWASENPDVTVIPGFDILTHTHIGNVAVAYATTYFSMEDKIKAYELAQEEVEKWIIKKKMERFFGILGFIPYSVLRPKLFRNSIKYIYSRYLYPRGY